MIKLQLHKSSCTDTIILARNMPHKKMTALYMWEHIHAIDPVHFLLYRSTPTPVLHKPKNRSAVEHRTGSQFGALLAWANIITLLHVWAGTAQHCTRQSYHPTDLSPSVINITDFFFLSLHYVLLQLFYMYVVLPVFCFIWLLSH